MYFDTLASADFSRYPARIVQGLQWLQTQDIDALPAGRVEIDGDAMYAQVIDLTTKAPEEVLPERHRRYLDVQYVHRGQEKMAVAIETGTYTVAKAYDEGNDILFYQQTDNESVLWVQAGQFAVFFPTDIHRPGMNAGSEAESVRKVVVKIAIDSL